MFSPLFAEHIDEMIARVPEADPGAFLREWQELARAKAPVA